MKIVVASGNKNKLREIAEIFKGYEVVSMQDAGFSEEIEEYRVSGKEPRVVDIPTGYTHNIENTGKTEMAVFMWCSETFDPKRPDTYAMKVRK